MKDGLCNKRFHPKDGGATSGVYWYYCRKPEGHTDDCDCPAAHEQLFDDERFPDVDWYCDRCGEHLNNQSGFDDHKYTWKCEACGHKNSISSDNIYESHEDFRGG